MKKISQADIIGDHGIALINDVVSRMGSIWRPTYQPEAGIDGFIEFRDPTTNVMLGKFVAVQSKATSVPFSSGPVTYVCDPKDLAYWTSLNIPVILVRSHPESGEAYWVHIQEYFSDAKRRASRKIIFDRERDRFDVSANDRLLLCAASGHPGFFPPLPRGFEKIFTNLLKVCRLPRLLYYGETHCSGPGEVWSVLKACGQGSIREWAYRGHRILSVHDLSERPWREICDPGTVETFSSDDWLENADIDQKNDFVNLLNQCLRSRLAKDNVLYDRDEEYYYFAPNNPNIVREVRYRTRTGRDKSRRVIIRHQKVMGDGLERKYYRHLAFRGRFRTYDGTIYLQIDPTYRYTRDGERPLPNSGNLLAGLRKRERNLAMLNHLVMLAVYLQDPPTDDLFAPSQLDPNLGFGGLLVFGSRNQVPEKLWLESKSQEERAEKAEELDEDVLDLAFEEGEAG